MIGPENTHHMGKYHCTADIRVHWFGCNQTSKYDANLSKVAESKQSKQEVSCTVILPLS